MSLRARLLRGGLAHRLASGRDRHADLAEIRTAFDALAERLPPPAGVDVRPAELGGVPGEWLVPTDPEPDQGMLYLHGGGYVLGSPASHRRLVARLAETVGVAAFVVDYRLAPEHPFPAALDDAVAAWTALTAEVAPERVLVAGDSAGGGLALALALRLRDEGRPLPGALATLSAWTDLTGASETIRSLAHLEPMLPGERLVEVADLYRGAIAATHPLISPLHADPTGLPPLLLQVGDHEILLDDSVRMHQRAVAAGVEATLRVYPGMWHVWQAFGALIPESARAFREIARFWWGVVGTVPQRRSTL